MLDERVPDILWLGIPLTKKITNDETRSKMKSSRRRRKLSTNNITKNSN